MANRNNVDLEEKDKLSIQAAALMLWLATSVISLFAMHRALDIVMSIYAGFWGDYSPYGKSYSTAIAIRQLLIIPFSILLVILVIGGAEYHYRHIGEPRSWRLFAQTLGAELAIFLMAMFI